MELLTVAAFLAASLTSPADQPVPISKLIRKNIENLTSTSEQLTDELMIDFILGRPVDRTLTRLLKILLALKIMNPAFNHPLFDAINNVPEDQISPRRIAGELFVLEIGLKISSIFEGRRFSVEVK